MNDILTLTLICGFTFLTGIGIGAVLNELIMKGEKNEEVDNTRR